MYLPLQPPPGPFASQQTLFEWLQANCNPATLVSQIPDDSSEVQGHQGP
jgi:hypothetical protein